MSIIEWRDSGYSRLSRLDGCDIPRRLRKWQVLDGAHEDFEQRLIAAIRNAL
jgi:hypothetical protein